MKRFIMMMCAVCFVLSLAILATAQGPGKNVVWDEKTQGKVTFSGKAHADAKLKCADCHSKPKLFAMKKSEHKMDDIKAGKSCGACHNGKKAFGVDDCTKCHKK